MPVCNPSIPRETPETKQHITHRNQQHFPLLKLPLELRSQIYGYVVGSATYYASHRFLGYTSSAYFSPTSEYPSHFRTKILPGSKRYMRWKNRKPSTDTTSVTAKKSSDQTLSSGLNLLLTSKQIHMETRKVLFRLNTFSFHSPKVFVSWTSHPMKRFITSVEIIFDAKIGSPSHRPRWTPTWKKARYEKIPLWSRSRFPSLRHLKLACRGELCLCSFPPPHTDGSEEWFAHMLSLPRWVENEVCRTNDTGLSITYAFYFRACWDLRMNWRTWDKDVSVWEWDGCRETLEKGVERMKERQSVIARRERDRDEASARLDWAREAWESQRARPRQTG